MNIDVHVEVDLSLFEKSILDIITALEVQTKLALLSSAYEVESNAKMGFGPIHLKGTPKTDKVRPQSISGDLRRSIQFIGSGVRNTPLGTEARVAPQMIYGRRVELGFPQGVHEYPYMYPAVMNAVPDILTYFTTNWQRALSGA